MLTLDSLPPWVLWPYVTIGACGCIFFAGLLISAISRAIVPPRDLPPLQRAKTFHETINPSCETDLLGQWMMIGGATPLVLAFHTIPMRLVQDVLIPIAQWMWDALVVIATEVARFVSEFFYQLFERMGTVARLVAQYLEVVWEIAVLPVIKFVGRIVSWIISTIGGIVRFVTHTVMKIIGAVVQMVAGIAQLVVEVLVIAIKLPVYAFKVVSRALGRA